MTVEASANGTFETSVLYGGQIAFTPVDLPGVKRTYDLFDPGNWTVRFRNTSPTNLELTYRITLVKTESATVWPYLWLRIPLFALGIFSMLLTIPAYFSEKMSKYVKRKDVNTIIILALVVVLLLSYQIAGFALSTSVPWIGAQGASMEPNLHEGDLVIIQGTPTEELVVEDVILYNKIALNTTSGQSEPLPVPILHRIIYKFKVGDRWYFQAQGDNNPTPDIYPIPADGVLGKAVLTVPKIGYVITLLTRIDVKIILIAIVALAYFVTPKLKLAYKKRREQKKPPAG
jgi:signal peptidase